VSTTDSPPESAEPTAAADLRAFRSLGAWWVHTVSGVIWLLYGMFVLSLRPASITSLAVLAGIAFILGGIAQFAIAQQLPVWRWLWYVGGVLGIAAGIAAFVWPDKTLLVMAVFVAWYLAIAGVLSVVAAFVGPRGDYWWMTLVVGVVQVGLGAWAIGSPERELLLLVNLVGIWLILYGIAQIFIGFAVRAVDKRSG
jgi:uncharacterized membrane protein HdeD (DUF308 family)